MATTIHTAFLRGVEAVPADVTCTIAEGGIPGIRFGGLRGDVPYEAASCLRQAVTGRVPHATGRPSIAIDVTPRKATAWSDSLALPAALGILVEAGALPHEVAVPGSAPIDLADTLVVGSLATLGATAACRGSVAYDDLARDDGRYSGALRPPDPDFPAPAHVTVLSGVRDLRPAGEGGTSPWTSGLDNPLDGTEWGAIAVVDADEGEVALVAERMARDVASWRAAGYTVAEPLHRIRRNWSVAGRLRPETDAPVVHARPSDSLAALVGGGRPPHPGLVTLADLGVLVADDLDDWSRAQLDALLSALEAGEARLVRSDGTYAMPADFRLVAAVRARPGEGSRVVEATPGNVRRVMMARGTRRR